MAIAISFMFGLGLYMVELTYYDAWYKGSLELHKSLGMVLLAMLIFRHLWQAFNTTPKEMAAPKWQQLSAKLMHRGLYIFMLLLMLSGYLISTADGRAIIVFDLIHIPALPWSIDRQEDIAGEIHNLLAWALIAMAVLHALAALKHHFINKDHSLVRMLKVDTKAH
jgi:cytochrome b561